MTPLPIKAVYCKKIGHRFRVVLNNEAEMVREGTLLGEEKDAEEADQLAGDDVAQGASTDISLLDRKNGSTMHIMRFNIHKMGFKCFWDLCGLFWCIFAFTLKL